ncbi:MAG: hypothetical protein ACI88A_004182 [Paraglaciecola sp.]|jgi:ABC-type multidrug transport system permease subunit
MFFVPVITIFFSTYYYVQSFKTGLAAKKWALAGLFLGPALLPLFIMQKRLALRQAYGFNCTFFHA